MSHETKTHYEPNHPVNNIDVWFRTKGSKEGNPWEYTPAQIRAGKIAPEEQPLPILEPAVTFLENQFDYRQLAEQIKLAVSAYSGVAHKKEKGSYPRVTNSELEKEIKTVLHALEIHPFEPDHNQNLKTLYTKHGLIGTIGHQYFHLLVSLAFTPQLQHQPILPLQFSDPLKKPFQAAFKSVSGQSISRANTTKNCEMFHAVWEVFWRNHPSRIYFQETGLTEEFEPRISVIVQQTAHVISQLLKLHRSDSVFGPYHWNSKTFLEAAHNLCFAQFERTLGVRADLIRFSDGTVFVTEFKTRPPLAAASDEEFFIEKCILDVQTINQIFLAAYLYNHAMVDTDLQINQSQHFTQLPLWGVPNKRVSYQAYIPSIQSVEHIVHELIELHPNDNARILQTRISDQQLPNVIRFLKEYHRAKNLLFAEVRNKDGTLYLDPIDRIYQEINQAALDLKDEMSLLTIQTGWHEIPW